jgi:hypothetical protein
VLLWGLFVGAAAAVLAPIGPGALVPLKMAVAAADSAGNDVYVAVVVDFGNGTTKTWCVPVAPNARDTDALAAAVGSSNVSYSSSGLLCAIDGYPSNGVQNCGQSVGNGDYDFWSYWHGSSGQWSYANNGPAGQSVSSPAEDVEGWKFQNGEPASSSDPPPGVAPSYAQICSAVPPTQTTTATGGASSAPTASGSSSGTQSSTPTTAEAPAGSGGATPTTSQVTTRSKGGTPTSSTTTTAGAAGTAGAPSATTTTSVSGGSNGSGGGSHGSSDARRITDASAAAHASSGGSSSDVLPGVLVGVVVVALAAFALVRWRRRPAEE